MPARRDVLEPRYRARIEAELSPSEREALAGTLALMRVPADRWPSVPPLRGYILLTALLRRVRRLEEAGHSRSKAILSAACYFGLEPRRAETMLRRAIERGVRRATNSQIADARRVAAA